MNLKLTHIEYNIIIHSLIYLSKYDKEAVFNYIKKFFKKNPLDKLFKIILEYNDLNDIDTQKNILIELFITELNKGNINMINDNFALAKKLIKFFYKDELIEISKNLFKNIYEIIGDKNFGEFISKLNKQDKNILLKNIDFYIFKDKSKHNKKKSSVTEFKIDLTNFNDSEKDKNKDDEENKKKEINDIKIKKLINKDNNTINEKPKIEGNKKEIKNKNELNELLINLNSDNNNFDLELYNKENDKNNNNIISNKLKLISILKDLFEDINFPKNKNIIISSIELFLYSLSNEINFFLILIL